MIQGLPQRDLALGDLTIEFVGIDVVGCELREGAPAKQVDAAVSDRHPIKNVIVQSRSDQSCSNLFARRNVLGDAQYAHIGLAQAAHQSLWNGLAD